MQCHSCLAEIPDKSEFCPICGAYTTSEVDSRARTATAKTHIGNPPSAPDVPTLESIQYQTHPNPYELLPPPPPPPVIPGKGRRQGQRNTLLLPLIFFLVVILAGASAFAFKILSPAGAKNPVVGHLYFKSSGQESITSNTGIADEVNLTIQLTQVPQEGESYYAWLQPDNPEGASFPLGPLTIKNGVGSLTYRDPHFTNLLAQTDSLLITEAETSPNPASYPSPDQSTWVYQAQLPTTLPPTQPGVKSFSALDHLRHLLADDPDLQENGLRGGLIKWFTHNTNIVDTEANTALNDTSATSINTADIRQQLVNVLTYTDGSPDVSKDVPPSLAFRIQKGNIATKIGILKINGSQQPITYINHIEFHLQGLTASPGVSTDTGKQAAQIDNELQQVNTHLQKVRTDAITLLKMNNAQLHEPEAVTLLQDLKSNADAAYSGQTSEQSQAGALQIERDIVNLATMNITAYHSAQ